MGVNRSNAFGCYERPDMCGSAGLQIKLLSVVIPARNEEGNICRMVEGLERELRGRGIPHEIIVVDDGSRDRTWEILEGIKPRVPTLNPVRNTAPFGFGRAVAAGLGRMSGDAVVIMMADCSDDCGDVARYWLELNRGYDCVFGSRFIKGSRVNGYPPLKLAVNRAANMFLSATFGFRYNDTTNAFKAYRREVIKGCSPFFSSDFSITVELPLKAFARGYSWKVVPISWSGRESGKSKLKLKEMGSRYFSACACVWIEKFLGGAFVPGRRIR